MTDDPLALARSAWDGGQLPAEFFRARVELSHRCAIALARRAVTVGAPPEWWHYHWGATRSPPLPFSGAAREKGCCPVCGQPTFRGGWWWDAGPPRARQYWHACCAVAHQIWTTYKGTHLLRLLRENQAELCPETGHSLRTAHGYLEYEVDHKVPLWRVRADRARYSWPEVLNFWGPDNLQLLTPEGHSRKTAREERERRVMG